MSTPTAKPTRAPTPTPTRPRVRRGAHRGGRRVAAVVMPSVLAVAAVAALVTSLAVWQGEERERARLDRAAPASPATSPAASAPPAGTAAPAPAVASSGGSDRPDGTARPVEPGTTSGSNRSPAAAPPAPVPADVQVVVLNQTSQAGLAGVVADRLRGAGWDVFGVGNFRGVVPATTVYFPDGQEAAALALAEALPTEPRVRARFGNLSTSRLTVVVTDSYPG